MYWATFWSVISYCEFLKIQFKKKKTLEQLPLETWASQWLNILDCAEPDLR